jgi:hypothetical protein
MQIIAGIWKKPGVLSDIWKCVAHRFDALTFCGLNVPVNCWYTNPTMPSLLIATAGLVAFVMVSKFSGTCLPAIARHHKVNGIVGRAHQIRTSNIHRPALPRPRIR